MPYIAGMDDATLTSKSQLTLPKAVRRALGVGPGDRIRFLPTRHGFQIVALRPGSESARGMFAGRRAAPLSIDEMNEAISRMGDRHVRKA